MDEEIPDGLFACKSKHAPDPAYRKKDSSLKVETVWADILRYNSEMQAIDFGA